MENLSRSAWDLREELNRLCLVDGIIIIIRILILLSQEYVDVCKEWKQVQVSKLDSERATSNQKGRICP